MSCVRRMTTIAKDLSSTVRLSDGVDMPLFGLGVFRAGEQVEEEAEKAVAFALGSGGYKMIDTAQNYRSEILNTRKHRTNTQHTLLEK